VFIESWARLVELLMARADQPIHDRWAPVAGVGLRLRRLEFLQRSLAHDNDACRRCVDSPILLCVFFFCELRTLHCHPLHSQMPSTPNTTLSGLSVCQLQSFPLCYTPSRSVASVSVLPSAMCAHTCPATTTTAHFIFRFSQNPKRKHIPIA